jgi:hypothetical protein
MGYDDDEIGEMLYGSEVGAARRGPGIMGRQLRGSTVRLPPKPAWRQDIAPGVGMPGVGLEPLPLAPSVNGGVFTSVFGNINFEARPQRPFRPERLIASIRRSTGAAAVAVRCTTILIGTQVGQVEVNDMDLDIFAPTSFDTRLNLPAATPGMLIRIPSFVLPAIAAGESIAVSLTFLGRTVR